MVLKQFVPSQVCLKCDGCCRWRQGDSIWRPKLGMSDQESLADQITGNIALDKEGYIKTVPASTGHVCRFLNSSDNTCRVYARRPWECLTYPFILARTPDAVKVYAHLSCPYVQDHQPSEEFDAYVDDLKGFFSRRDVREFLTDNKAMFHDYTPYAGELLYLFDVSF